MSENVKPIRLLIDYLVCFVCRIGQSCTMRHLGDVGSVQRRRPYYLGVITFRLPNVSGEIISLLL